MNHAAIDGGLVLIAEDGEVNGAERFPEEITRTQVAQSLVSAGHEDWSSNKMSSRVVSAGEKLG
jgi:hypothetical protein